MIAARRVRVYGPLGPNDTTPLREVAITRGAPIAESAPARVSLGRIASRCIMLADDATVMLPIPTPDRSHDTWIFAAGGGLGDPPTAGA